MVPQGGRTGACHGQFVQEIAFKLSHPPAPDWSVSRPVNARIKLSSPETREFWEIPVLWEDARLLALDKPGQLPTSTDRCDPQRPNLMKLLHRDITRGAAWARERQLTYLANAHR